MATSSHSEAGNIVAHMRSGTFTHETISGASAKRFECPLGWITHYTIGVSLTLVFLAIASADWLLQPTLAPALVFGVVTVVFPFFVMQPSLGLGVASSKTRNAGQARLKSLVTHTVFGFGLYVCALGASYLLTPHAS